MIAMIARWWFQRFGIFTSFSPLFGEDFHFDYFSDGLKPQALLGKTCAVLIFLNAVCFDHYA